MKLILKMFFLLSLIILFGLTSCSLLLPHNSNSYQRNQEKRELIISDLPTEPTEPKLKNAYKYLQATADATADARTKQQQCVDAWLETNKYKYQKKLEEIGKPDAADHMAPILAPIITGLGNMVIDQVGKKFQKAIEDDQEKHIATYSADLVTEELMKDSNNPNYGTIKLIRSIGNNELASEFLLGVVLIPEFDKGVCNNIAKNSADFDEWLKEPVPKSSEGRDAYKAALKKLYDSLGNKLERNYNGVIVPIDAQIKFAAAKVYEPNYYLAWFPLFWYQLFIDSSNDIDVSAKLQINDSSIDFSYPRYRIGSNDTSLQNLLCTDKKCANSYKISGVSPAKLQAVTLSITETDPANIKVVGDYAISMEKDLSTQGKDALKKSTEK